LGAFIFSNNLHAVASSPNAIHVIQLNDDTINPITAEYITQAIDRAQEVDAQCLVIKMDTPGGLLTSTRTIVKAILSARIPVIVYISPSGSRAGSAGVFITYASHIAAMAPSTNIGAAHPVQMGGGQRRENKDIWKDLQEFLQKSRTEKEKSNEQADKKDQTATAEKSESASEPADADHSEIDPDPMSDKILQDTTAFIRSLAVKRGRNIEWAVKSVTESSSITETEALELGVIELIAQNYRDLFEKLDGRVIVVQGNETTLRTKNAAVETIGMEPRQKLFNILANPNIAYMLLILGFYGLLYEVTHPGFGFPGIMGTIFLILAFYSMQTLPTNYAGLALVGLGLVFFVAEAFVPGFGIFTFGGLVCMILGSLLLFDSPLPIMRVSFSLILAFSLATAGITVFLVQRVIHSHRQKVISGKEGLIGQEAEVKKPIVANSKEGKVYVHGELWNAFADENLNAGDKVIVSEVKGMKLKVKKV